MKQAKVKLPSGTYLIQEVQKGSKDFEIKTMVSMPHLFYHYPEPYYELLDPGSWRLLGADPTRLTEEEAGEIVEWLEEKVVTPLMNTYVRFYKDYQALGNGYEFDLDGSVESLDSLAASLGISKPFVVLKK